MKGKTLSLIILMLGTVIIAKPSNAEGGCPHGFLPNAGYCQNITCPPLNGGPIDRSTVAVMKKYNMICKRCGVSLNGHNVCYTEDGGNWGSNVVPKR
jgi:hypothetical protein